MQTNLVDYIKNTPDGREADAILRKCVHCGFCTATCPTYQLLGDELDGPRGRIYLIKQVLEGQAVTQRTQLHLDRCLTCRACETSCPSGVRYGRLADIGRGIVELHVPRSPFQRLLRRALREVLPHRRRFSALLRLGQAFRPLMPSALKRMTPPRRSARSWPQHAHQRRMLVLDGCVQPAIAPDINASVARVLDRLEVSLVAAPGAGCCGAVSYHLAAQEEGLDYARRNIDAWWPEIEKGAEAIVMTASGCGAMVKEYGDLLAHDSRYAEKAKRVSELTLDVSQVLAREDLSTRLKAPAPEALRRVAFHSPCTLQHGLKLRRVVEPILTGAGYELTPVPNAHLCCGSAGTYSILQPRISKRLLDDKIAALESEQPDVIATANIGCLVHLESAATRPVVHWISLLDRA